MATQRMMPPSGGPFTCNTPGGRTYSCAAGSSIDVPDFDAAVLAVNGWVFAASGGAGVTALRPTNLKKVDKGTQFHDTTLGINIIWDGAAWRNPTSGAAV